MIAFLLIISFLLHIISLVALFQLIKQQQQNKQQESSQEVMAVLEVYLTEIKEENNRLEDLLAQQQKSQTHPETKVASEKVQVTVGASSKEIEESEEKDDSSELDELLNELPKDQLNASLESKVLQLHAQGQNLETIAKTLGCGKTEAELIIKLYNKA